MSIIGTVSNLVGRAVAVKADGSERELAMGDQVFADELIRVSPDGSLEIAMETGEPLLLEGGQSWLATAETYQDSEQFDTSEAVADVESIQAAILAGADPTEVAEETAAGGEGEAEGNEGSSFVQVEATREEVDPTAGFETGGIADEIPSLSSEELIVPLSQTVSSVPKISINDVTVEEPDSNPFVATNAGDATAIVTTLIASEGDVFSFDWNFIDGDGGFYNDFAFVSINGQITTLADLLNGDFVAGETGIQTFSIELDAGSHTIAIGVADAGDSIIESPLEVSNVSLNSTPIAALNFSGGMGDWSAIGSALIDSGVVTLSSSASELDVESAAGMAEGAIDAQAALNASGSVIATFTVTLDQPAVTDVTVDFTTADGTAIAGGTGIAENDYGATSGTVTIPAGSTSATIQVYVYGDNYQEGDEQFFLKLSNPENAEILDDSGVGTVLDNDEIVFTLTASDEYFGEEQEEFVEIPTETSNSVTEGGTASYIITLTGADLAEGQVVVLDVDVKDGTALYLEDYSDISGVSGAVSFNPATNQLTIEGPFNVGDVVASFSIPTIDDAFAEDTEQFTVALTAASEGTAQGTVTTTIYDDTDTTTVTLTGAKVNEGAGTAIVSASVNNAPETDLVLTLSTGDTITILAGETSGSTEVNINNDEDVYLDASELAISITNTSGGNYESLNTSDTTTVSIADTIDTTTLTLDNVTVDEGTGTATISAELSAAPTEGPVEFTLSNGATIKFEIGETTATSSEFSVQGDDVYVDGENYTVSVSSYTGGDEYENLVTTDTADVTVEDTTDTVTATLTTSTVEISEDGGSITYIVNLSGAPGSVDPDNDLVFTLTNPDGSGDPIEVTVVAGATTGQVVVNYSDSEITNQTSFDNSIASFTGGAEYENLSTSGSTTVPVDYKPEISDLTPTAQGGDVTVDEDDLPTGSDGNGSLTEGGTFTVAAEDGIKELTVGSLSVIENGIYQGDGINITTPEGHTFTITGYNETSGVVSYTYTLNENENHDPVQGENAFFESLNVYLEDTDGDSTTDTLAAKIVDDIPAVVATAPGEISYELTITNHDYESSAGYNSSYGYYIKDENGNPTEGHVIWDGVQDADAVTASVTITGYTPDQVGFFIIPNGNNLNPGLDDGTDVTFNFVSGQWQAFADGTSLTGAGSHVLFDVAALNLDSQGHVVDNALDGNQNWEDLQIPTGDGDFNDLNVNAEWTALSHLRVDETALTESTSTSSLSVDYSGQFTLTPGADGIASLAYELSVDGNSGLYDTAENSEVLLRVNAAGDVEGYVNDNDIVFTLTVDDAGVATLTQFRAVMHDDPTDHDETVSPATLLTGAITLSAIVTDGDGDKSQDGFDIGTLLAFEDDGPAAVTDTVSTNEDTAIIIDVLANDTQGADGASVTAVTQPANGVVDINDDGTLTFTPAGNLHGQETFTYTLTDRDGDTSTSTVTVNVDAVADAPTLVVSVVNEMTLDSDENLIVNGSFEDVAGLDENGDPVDDMDLRDGIGGFYVKREEISGWKTTEGAPMEPHYTTHAGVGTTDGVNYMDMGATPGNTSITQELNLIAGAEYKLSFDYRDKAAMQEAGQSGEDSGVMQVLWNGNLVATVQGNNRDAWESLSNIVLVGIAGTNTLTFAEVGDADDNWGIAIDNVELFHVPYQYDLTVTSSLTDVDGSELLGDVAISTLPAGVTLEGSTLTSDTPLTDAQINSITASVKSTETSNSDEAETITNAKVEFAGLDATGETADLLIEGTSGGDAIIGGEGDDIIFGKAGDDSLEGGAGADLFVWEGSDVGTIGDPAHDTVTDFNSAEDVLNLTDLLSDGSHTIEGIDNGTGDLQVNIKDSGGNVVQEIELSGVGIAGDASETLQTLLDTGAIDDGI